MALERFTLECDAQELEGVNLLENADFVRVLACLAKSVDTAKVFGSHPADLIRPFSGLVGELHDIYARVFGFPNGFKHQVRFERSASERGFARTGHVDRFRDFVITTVPLSGKIVDEVAHTEYLCGSGVVPMVPGSMPLTTGSLGRRMSELAELDCFFLRRSRNGVPVSWVQNNLDGPNFSCVPHRRISVGGSGSVVDRVCFVSHS